MVDLRLPSDGVGGDDTDQWILPGIHMVNRICFLVTEVAHSWCDVQFRIPHRGYSLTSLGLKRQVNKIRVALRFAG